jgi:4-hydroxyphenylpyruvate dioxygenase
MPGKRLSGATGIFGGKLADKLQAMSAVGFAATELLARDLFEHPDGPEITVEALRQNKLTVSAFQALRNFEGADPAMRDRKFAIARNLMDQMAIVGSDLLVLCSNLSTNVSADPDILVADLRELGDLARSRNLRIAYEALCWAPIIWDYREAWRLIERVNHDSVGLVLDSFHIFARELPLDDIRRIPGDKVFLVELADLPRLNVEPLEASRHYRLFPGEGIAPLGPFVELVERIGFTGHYALEIFNSFYATEPVNVTAARAMTALQRLFNS